MHGLFFAGGGIPCHSRPPLTGREWTECIIPQVKPQDNDYAANLSKLLIHPTRKTIPPQSELACAAAEPIRTHPQACQP